MALPVTGDQGGINSYCTRAGGIVCEANGRGRRWSVKDGYRQVPQGTTLQIHQDVRQYFGRALSNSTVKAVSCTSHCEIMPLPSYGAYCEEDVQLRFLVYHLVKMAL